MGKVPEFQKERSDSSKRVVLEELEKLKNEWTDERFPIVVDEKN